MMQPSKQPTTGDPSHFSIRAFAMPILFLALLTVTQLINQAALGRQNAIARQVTIADEQKLTTVELMNAVRDVQAATNDAERTNARQALPAQISAWETSHQALTVDSDPDFNNLHAALLPSHDAIAHAASCIAGTQTCTDALGVNFASMLINTASYNDGVEQIAAQYEVAETNVVQQATSISWVLFFLTISVLSAIGYLVLRPAAIRQTQTLIELAASRSSLQAIAGEAEARSTELRTVADLSAQISTILEVNTLLREVTNLTKERLQLYHAHIYLLNPAGDTLVLTAGAGEVGQQMVAEKRSIPLNHANSIVANAARSLKGVTINNVQQTDTFLPHPLLSHTRSELAMPLVARGQLIGVLDIQSDQADFFNETKASVIELMAAQIAVAISNARLYQASERISFRERILGSLDRDLQVAVSMDEILRTATRELAKGLELPESTLEIKLSEKRLNSKTWAGYLDATSTAEVRQAVLDGPKTDPLSRIAVSQITQPIMVRGTRIGSIVVKPEDGVVLTTDDKELVQDTARLVGQALDQFRSIDEIKRSEETARAAQQFLDSIIENIPNMVFVKDAEHLNFVSLNKAGEELLGVQREDMIGKSDYHFYPEEQANGFTSKDREVLASNTLVDIPEETIKTADGKTRYLHTKKIPLRDATGQTRFLLGISEDITERKQAQSDLIESERRYRQIVEEATDVVYTIDPAGFFTYVSPSAKRLTGFEPDELMGRHFTELLPKGEGWRKRLIEFYLDQVQQRIPQTTLNFPILTAQGERKWVEQQVTVTIHNHDVVGLQSVTRDVTERVLQDEAIQASRVRAELLGLVNAALSQATTEEEILTAISVIVIERNIHYALLAYVDSVDHYQISNAEITALYSGFGEPMALETLPSTSLPTEYQVLTRGWVDGLQSPIYIDDIQTLDEAQRSYFQNQNIGALVLVPLRTGDDWQAIIAYVWTEAQAFSTDFRDMVESMMPTAASVVASRRAYTRMQDAREQAERRSVNLEAVAQVSATATTILDADTLLKTVADLTRDRFRLYHAHIYLLDDAGEKLILAAGAGEPGSLMKERAHFIPYERPNSLVAQAARQRHAVIVNDVRQSPDFLPNPLLPETHSELALPMVVADKLVGVLDVQHNVVDRFSDEDVRVLTALTDQVAVAVENSRAFQEQQKTAERLREVDRLKSQFLANMSHELRTPLNSIIGYAEVLLDGIDGDLNEEATEDVLAIHGGGKHLLTIINDILDLAKIEAGQMNIEPYPVDLPEVIKDVVDTCDILARNKGLELKVNLSNDLPLVSGDAIRLKQIILNLVNNAIKFTNSGSVTINAEPDQANMVKLRIVDTGMGMTPDEMKGLFQQFNQVDNSPTRRAGGTGLGLVITRHLVTMHHGVVDVESQKGVGSTFWFTVPIHINEPTAAHS
ncbi:MAG: GAF domain-containing protein [Chloroflexi bacterium]|nr:GAF domain-containing protein [Chloroflexota bacterium]MCC6894197.1 GAF domain-containing protein [Anaerolineae bacterium]